MSPVDRLEGIPDDLFSTARLPARRGNLPEVYRARWPGQGLPLQSFSARCRVVPLLSLKRSLYIVPRTEPILENEVDERWTGLWIGRDDAISRPISAAWAKYLAVLSMLRTCRILRFAGWLCGRQGYDQRAFTAGESTCDSGASGRSSAGLSGDAGGNGRLLSHLRMYVVAAPVQ